MELEREHTDNNAAISATEPAPVSSSRQEAAQSVTLELHLSEPRMASETSSSSVSEISSISFRPQEAAQSKSASELLLWPLCWNPLNLSRTETSDFNAQSGKFCCFNSNFIYSLYFFFCTFKNVLFSAAPLFVFLRNPFTDNKAAADVFWALVGIISVYSFSFWFFYYDLFRQSGNVSFFKVVLVSERCKELPVFKSIFTIFQLIFVGMIAGVRIQSAAGLKDCLEKQNIKISNGTCPVSDGLGNTCDCWLPPADSPSLLSLNFFLLSFTYLILCYNILTYDDCFAGHMLPDRKFMIIHHPDMFHISKDIFGEYRDSDSMNQIIQPIRDMIYEPNIPIRPVYTCCTWFLTDSRDNLRNILLVCDRVAVLWQLHHSQLCQIDSEIQNWKIKDFRNNADIKKCIDRKLLDDSLIWEYVLLHCPLFLIILILSIGTFKK